MQLLKSEYYELPNNYNRTIIRLLVQSPTRMFVYWEVSDDTIKIFNDKYHNYDDSVVVLLPYPEIQCFRDIFKL